SRFTRTSTPTTSARRCMTACSSSNYQKWKRHARAASRSGPARFKVPGTAMLRRDLYAILGLADDADLAAVKRAYRALVFQLHPDTGASPDPARFAEVREAYETLIDDARRRSHDLERRPEPIVVRRRPATLRRRPMTIPDDFGSAAPSVDEFL